MSECINCDTCLRHCPPQFGAIFNHGTDVTILPELCSGCGKSLPPVCPAFCELQSRCRNIIVAGLSMGGTITAWLAARHPEVAGIVLVNPTVEPAADSFMEAIAGMKATGATVMQGIGSDVANPDVQESAYADTPLAPLESLFGAVSELQPLLPEIRCPVLLFTSVQDHVVAPSSSDHLA